MFKKTILIFLSLTPLIALCEGSIGALSTYSQSLYKETNGEPKLLPAISYKGERFYLNFPEIGYHLIPRSPFQSLSAGLRYTPSMFDPDESNNEAIQLLDDRDDSTMAFVSYRFGPITAKLAQDISGIHNGYYGQLSLGYPISIDAWRVIPSIRYQQFSEEMSDYMFGVSQTESAKTSGTISAYNSPAISRTSYGATAFYSITKNMSTMISIRQTQYDESIKQSPIVNDDTVNSFLVGIFYKF
jgi:outer membrane protein